MIPLTLAYTMGLVLGHLFPLSRLALFLYLLGFLVCLIVWGIGKLGGPLRAARRPPGLSRILRFSPLLLACVLLGHTRLSGGAGGQRCGGGEVFPLPSGSLAPFPLCSFSGSGPVDLTGTLCLPPEVAPGRLGLCLEAEEVYWQGKRYRVEGRARIAFYAPWGNGELAYGDRLRLRQMWLRPARGFRNFGGFDYEAYLAQRGIQALGSLSRPERLSILARDQGSPGWAWIYRLKGRMLAFLDRTTEGPGRASLKAIVLGERGALSPEMVRVFNESGITHLLAISGQQVGLVALAAFGLLGRFLAFVRFDLLFRYPLSLRPSKVAALLTFWPILLYALLVGGGHSVTRATIMVAVYLVTVMLDRQRDLAHTLLLAALLILLWQPEALFDVGFQLSFAAVGGIILAVSRFPSRPEGEGAPSLRRKLSLFLLISLYANLSTLPLVIYYFQRISLVGPLTNLAAIPLSSAAVPLGLLACLLSLVHDLLAIPPLSMSLLLFDATYFLARTLARLPQASIPLPSPSILTLIAFYALVVSTAFLLPAPRERRGTGAEELLPRSPDPPLLRTKWVACVSALALVLSLSWRQIFPPSHDRLLRVTFLDVGPGEASLLQLPDGQTLLFLGGGLRPWGFDVAEGVIVPFLRWEGIDRIDWLVAGRLTWTHLRMLESLLERFEVKQVCHREREHPPPWIEDLALRKGTTLKAVRHGFRLEGREGWELSLFDPQGPPWYDEEKGRSSVHGGSRSLVLQVGYGKRGLLLAGDLDRRGQGSLLDQGKALKSDVLKVPGHGGPSCRLELLERVRPQVAVLSVGSPNRFGHPLPQVVQTLEALGAKIYRTDRDGCIRLSTDGEELWVETYAQLRGSPFGGGAHRRWALVRWF